MNKDILNKIMENYLNKVKNLREQLFVQDKLILSEKKEEFEHRVLDFKSFNGFDDFSFYHTELNTIRTDMLQSYFYSLISEQKINEIKIINNKHILALLHYNNNKYNLYYFKEYGPLKLTDKYNLAQLNFKFKPDSLHLVSLTTGNPNSYILNAEEIKNKEINLETFFNNIFNNEEYTIFLDFINQFNEEIKRICSLSTIKTLTETTSYFFSKQIKDYLLSAEFESIITKYNSKSNLNSASLDCIKRNFFENERYRTLTQKSAFADSIITAEWMYESLNNISNIDLTVISLGYFKALEQFLYEFIKSHSGEDRKIKKMNYKELKNKPNKIFLNDLAIEKGYINFMLDSLIDFLQDPSNKDIFESTIDELTINHITDCLECVKMARNGYFHKDNMTDWEIVQYSREIVLISIYYLLGSIKIENKQIDALNIPTEKVTHYTKICEFFHYNRCYLYRIITEKEQFLAIASSDNNRTIDKNNEPIYSGIYVTRYTNVPVESTELSLKNIANIQTINNYKIDVNDKNLVIEICSFSPYEKGFRITSPYKTIYKNMQYVKNS